MEVSPKSTITRPPPGISKLISGTPKQFPTHAKLDDHPPPPPILRPGLDPAPVHPRQTLQSPRVANPHLRRLPRRAPLVSDALVHLRHRPVHPHPPADAAGGGAPLAQPLALARRPRRPPRHRLRHDPPADPDPLPRRRHPVCVPGVGQRHDHRGESERAESRGPRVRVPEFRIGRRRGVKECLVLGRPDRPAAHLCRVRKGVPQGTALQTVIRFDMDGISWALAWYRKAGQVNGVVDEGHA